MAEKIEFVLEHVSEETRVVIKQHSRRGVSFIQLQEGVFLLTYVVDLRTGEILDEVSDEATLRWILINLKAVGRTLSCTNEIVNGFLGFSLDEKHVVSEHEVRIEGQITPGWDSEINDVVTELPESVSIRPIKDGVGDEHVKGRAKCWNAKTPKSKPSALAVKVLSDVVAKREVEDSQPDDEDSPSIPEGGNRDSVFICYSSRDRGFVSELHKMLQPYRDSKLISNVWWDKEIEAGDNWREKIDEALERTAVAVLVVSVDFFDSKFIQDVELPYFMEKAKGNEVIVTWVAYGESGVDKTPIWNLQCLNNPKIPLKGLKPAQREKEQKKIAIQLDKFKDRGT